MWIGVVTLFPEMFTAISESGITRRAIENGLLSLEFWNPRDFASDRHRTVDDKPFGGGPGMLMKVAPLRAAISAARVKAPKGCQVVYLSPQGKKFDQRVVKKLAGSESLILVAGRYEGIDERVVQQDVDCELSIGDFVVSGGELPAMVVIDAVTRMIPGAVGDPESVEQDSFYGGLLNYPQFTRPEEFEGQVVPAVLLSGDHEKIRQWRRQQALGRTYERRPELLTAVGLNDEEKALLAGYINSRQEH